MRALAQITITTLLDGEKGDTGIGIVSTEVKYQSSTSGTTAPIGEWKTSIPTVAAGNYLWTRTILTYSDGNSSTSYSVSKVGEKGSTGTGIESVTAEYAKSTSKTSAPTTGWAETAPEWEVGHYIWTRTKIVYNNPTSIEYTTPYCDSSWEAIDDIKIGTVNLIRNAKTMIYKDYSIVLASRLSIFAVDGSTLNISSVSTTVQDGIITFSNNEAKVENNVLILGKE